MNARGGCGQTMDHYRFRTTWYRPAVCCLILLFPQLTQKPCVFVSIRSRRRRASRACRDRCCSRQPAQHAFFFCQSERDCATFSRRNIPCRCLDSTGKRGSWTSRLPVLGRQRCRSSIRAACRGRCSSGCRRNRRRAARIRRTDAPCERTRIRHRRHENIHVKTTHIHQLLPWLVSPLIG